MSKNSTLSLTAGELLAVFWPDAGMLCASLRYRGEELLRRIDDLEVAKRKGSTAGIPLLYPWANRLSSLRYHAAGCDVHLDPASALLHFDDRGLPMHGIPWGQLKWKVLETNTGSVSASLKWHHLDLLAIFPFPHTIEIKAKLISNSLTMQTTVFADSQSPVPISFGFHPYFGIPHLPRTQWRLQLPSMRRLELDAQGIPTGKSGSFAAFDGLLANTKFDDGFALHQQLCSFSLSGPDCRITIQFLESFPYAQVFAPNDKDFIALEPMTAPTNALISGKGLNILSPGSEFRASFSITVGPAQ